MSLVTGRWQSPVGCGPGTDRCWPCCVASLPRVTCGWPGADATTIFAMSGVSEDNDVAAANKNKGLISRTTSRSKRMSSCSEKCRIDCAGKTSENRTTINNCKNTFDKNGEQEYLEAVYDSNGIIYICVFLTILRVLDSLKGITAISDDTNGGLYWRFLTWGPVFASSFVFVGTAITFKSSSVYARRFCLSNYDALCSFVLVAACASMTFPRTIIEIRRSEFQVESRPHIQWKMHYAGIFPVRECKDTNPEQTYQHQLTTVESAGCINALLGAVPLAAFTMYNILPPMLHMRPMAAAITAILNFVIFSCALCATGSNPWHSLPVTLNLFLMSLFASYHCKTVDQAARQTFAVLKRTKDLADHNSDLLRKFIPEAVLSNLAKLPDDEIGVNIDKCIIMFCSLEPQQDLRAACSELLFHRLHALFSKLDDAVERRGMFKYQHVGEWYIVACPRAANPFDPQPKECSEQYAAEMLLLARELKEITLGNQLWGGGGRFWLKVGVASGPAAGVVIGLHRRFYCLYGDTVNTASRMCKPAGDKIHCDAAFADDVRRARLAFAVCESRGETEVKGKGRIETFEVSVDAHAATERPSYCSCRTQIRKLSISLDDLSPENRRWAEAAAPTHDAALWRDFERFHAGGRRERLIFSILLHAAVVMVQWAASFLPEHPYAFTPGDRHAVALEHAATLMGVHLVLSLLWSTALIVALLLDPNQNLLWRRHFVGLKVFHLTFCLGGVVCFPGTCSMLSSYAVAQVLLSGWLAPIGARKSGILIAASAVLATASCVVAGMILEVHMLLSLLAMAAGSVVFSRRHDQREHFLWSLHRAMADELVLLQRRLRDLIPTQMTDEPELGPAPLACEVCTAAVLQLDVCGFTAMSQGTPPMEVARLLHGLFVAFDQAVLSHGLYKLDTVGDAYLAAAFRPDGRAAAGVLAAARAMLAAMAECRRATGRDVRCRIGIAVGQVVAGVLGRLQPRFHILGDGARDAEAHETGGPAGAVHVSDAFLRLAGPHLDARELLQWTCFPQLSPPSPLASTPFRSFVERSSSSTSALSSAAPTPRSASAEGEVTSRLDGSGELRAHEWASPAAPELRRRKSSVVLFPDEDGLPQSACCGEGAGCDAALSRNGKSKQ